MTVDLKARLRQDGIKLVDLALAVGVNKSSVTRWAEKGVPPERVLEVERITGISRHVLRPDLHGPGPADTPGGAPQLGNSGVEGGAGEAAAGHDASLAEGAPAVTANAAGGFA
ncbi:YdaS family helix-turn-helix protein [Xanthobacter sp.]|uniref:YdaS family helix-turn-helix protein n=1 Tax=Xanthobacter sp. TaxID=35809 RepID=UPI0025F34839|nr:YdaS family helix-turn-helix protein [Xanthobacter sp.]